MLRLGGGTPLVVCLDYPRDWEILECFAAWVQLNIPRLLL